MTITLVDSVQSIFIRDLGKLEAELLLYPTEQSVWMVDKNIKNSAGNLCLHLCGNLQHYIGAVLGSTDYIRDRDHEFSAKDISREILIREINAARKAIQETLPKLTEEQLTSDYPVNVLNFPMTTSFFLIHLTAHLGYHLGQVNYHRRLLV